MTPETRYLNNANLRQLFIHQLNRVNCTKSYLVRNLPKLSQLASFKTMQLAIEEDISDVKKQQLRIEEMYKLLDAQPSDDGCEVIKSVIEEAYHLGHAANKPTIVNDMDIILYMQLIENIEFTSFRMLKLIAQYMDNGDLSQRITECFDEHVDNSHLFMLISEEYLSKKVQQ